MAGIFRTADFLSLGQQTFTLETPSDVHSLRKCEANQMDKKSDLAKSHSFDDALQKCGFGKFNYLLIFLAGGLMASANIELTSVNIILPIAQCDLNLSTSDKGILSAIGYVGLILSSHFWGFLADTKGRKTTLVPSLVLAFISTVASSLANNFWLLVSLRFLNGFL